MKRLIANWAVDEERGKILLDEYQPLFYEYGNDRFTRAVDSLVAICPYKFFPTQAEFRGYIPKAEKKPLCGKCEEGWIRVPDYEARIFYGNETATAMLRCECRRGPGFQKYESEVRGWNA